MKTLAKILTMLIFLLPSLLLAESFPEINMDKMLSEKRAIVKETMQLTEKESAVFWPLYDDYEKVKVNIINKYSVLIRKYMQERENLSNRRAKAMIKKLLEIEAYDLKLRREYVNKFSEKLSDKRVFQYFLLEGRIDAGFFALIAEELPPIQSIPD